MTRDPIEIAAKELIEQIGCSGSWEGTIKGALHEQYARGYEDGARRGSGEYER